MGTALPIAPDVAAAATHGQYCPKMCTFACPVTEATGRDDAVPWSFHREVADLATGRAEELAGVGDRLVLCNGCLACRDACTYEQDVPAQVVAGRTALADADVVSEPARRYAGHVRDGLGRDGNALPDLPASDPESTTAFVVGQDETQATLRALRTLATRAGRDARFVRGGGATAARLAALGLHREAEAAEEELATSLEGVASIVVTDPELLAAARRAAPAEARVVDLGSWSHAQLEAGSLIRSSAPALGSVTFHDPPGLARGEGATTAPRQVLRLLGGVIVEPEGHGEKTVSAGPGLAMEVLAPDAVALVAARRAAQLAATGVPVVSTGAAEVAALRAAGLAVVELAELLAARTAGLHVPPNRTAAPAEASSDDAPSQDSA